MENVFLIKASNSIFILKLSARSLFSLDDNSFSCFIDSNRRLVIKMTLLPHTSFKSYIMILMIIITEYYGYEIQNLEYGQYLRYAFSILVI